MFNCLLIVINSEIITPIWGYFIFSFWVIFVYHFMRNASQWYCISNYAKCAPIWLMSVANMIIAISYGTGTLHSPIASFVVFFGMPVIVFISGYIVVAHSFYDNYEVIVKKALCAIAIGCSINVFFNMMINFGSDRYHTVDFFSGGQSLAATNLGSVNTFIFSLVPCILISKSKKIRIGGLILITLSLAYGLLVLGTRTQFVVLLIVCSVIGIIYICENFNGKISKTRFVFFAFSCPVLVVCIIYIYHNDIWGLKTIIEGSNLFLRFTEESKVTSASDSYRINLFVEGLKNLFENPMGNKGDIFIYDGSVKITYFHNYWLDMGRVAGLVPVILILLYDIFIIFHSFVIYKNKNIAIEVRVALLGICIGTFANFFVEPILDGYTSLLYRFYFINGIIEGIYYHNEKKIKCS